MKGHLNHHTDITLHGSDSGLLVHSE